MDREEYGGEEREDHHVEHIEAKEGVLPDFEAAEQAPAEPMFAPEQPVVANSDATEIFGYAKASEIPFLEPHSMIGSGASAETPFAPQVASTPSAKSPPAKKESKPGLFQRIMSIFYKKKTKVTKAAATTAAVTGAAAVVEPRLSPAESSHTTGGGVVLELQAGLVDGRWVRARPASP